MAFECYSAPVLFIQAAQRKQASFDPTQDEQVEIVRICRLVEGMPLALELAASWVRVLSCREIAREIEASIEASLGFLSTTLRDLPARHRSMQAVFDQSWRLLSAAEQQVFAGCSVFRGGFTREAAVEVAGATLPILAALMDKSLLSRDRQGRYTVHELARQYAAAQLIELEHMTQTRDRHLTYFMTLSEEAEPRLRSGPQIVQWYDRIEREHDNLRSALDWAFTDGEFEAGMRMVGALWEFWMNRGYANEGQSQAERFLARPEAAAPTSIRVKGIHTAGALAFYQGHLQDANSWSIEGITISRGLGPRGKPVLGLMLNNGGYAALGLRDIDRMEVLSQESLALGHELQDAWVRGHAWLQFGLVDLYRRKHRMARQRFLESFMSFKADGESVMRGIALKRLGTTLYEEGDYASAHTYLSQSLSIFEKFKDKVRSIDILRELKWSSIGSK